MRRIFPLFIVLFLGALGFSFTFPLFTPLFLEPEHTFLPFETAQDTRRILLGILFAVYPAGQFIGASFIGKLSDKCGRRPVVLMCLALATLAVTGSALAIHYALPTLLYVSRFINGLLAGNTVIVQAAIADISKDAHTKAKRFGFLNSLSSTAFFFGPLIGGYLADARLVSWFDYDTPFWFAAILTLTAFFIVFHLLKESHQKDPTVSISLKSILKTFVHGFTYKRLRTLYCSNFFVFLGIFFFLNFFPAYLVNRFDFSFTALGRANAYLAIPFIISPFFFATFSKWWTVRRSMRLGMLCVSISYLIFVQPSSPWALLITLLPVGFFLAMGFAFPAIMISDTVDQRIQGQALGVNQALLVLAEAFTALIGGFLMALHIDLPIYAGAVCAVVAGFILFISNQPE